MGLKPRREKARETMPLKPGMELRTWRLSDAAALYECVDRNRQRLRQWMPWVDGTQSAQGQLPFLQNCVDGYRNRTCYRMGIWIDDKIAGGLSLEDIDPMHRRAMIGYWLSYEHEGQGIMTAAVRAIIDYGLGERALATLSLRAATDNKRSRAVAERVGMRYEGILRQREWLYDHFVDHASYSLLASEWSSGRGTRPQN